MDDTCKFWYWLLHWVLENRESHAHWGMTLNHTLEIYLNFVDFDFRCCMLTNVGLKLSPYLFSRLTDRVGYQCWGSVTVSRMLQTKQRSMMILQWSTCHMFSSYLLSVSLFTLWSMSATRVGTLGSSLPLRAVSTCLVSILILFSALLPLSFFSSFFFSQLGLTLMSILILVGHAKY